MVRSFVSAIEGYGGYRTLEEIDPQPDHVYRYPKPAVFVVSSDADHHIEFPENYTLQIKIMVVAHSLNDPEGRKAAKLINRYLDNLVVKLKLVQYAPGNHLRPRITRSGGSRAVVPPDETMRVGFINISAPMYVSN